MSSSYLLKPSNAGIYQINALNVNNFWINGVPFQQYIEELVIGDQFEQAEIDEIRQIIQYLNTNGLTTEWVVNNDNINAELKTAIIAIQNKLTYLDTTDLSGNWVVNNDNRNAVLKTRLDNTDASLNIVNGKTRYVTSEQGNDSGTPTASYLSVSIADRIKRQIALTTGANAIGLSNNSTNQATAGEYTENYIQLSSPNGMISSDAHLNRIIGSNKVEISAGNIFGIGGQHDLNIGALNNRINIGSVDTPEVGTTTTEITIGKRAVSKNTSTTLAGNFYTGDARWESLSKSSALTWSQLLSLVSTSGLPAWVASFALTSSLPNFSYSDVWTMKAVSEAGGLIKNGEVETNQSAKLKNLTIYDTDVGVDLLAKEGTFFAKGDISKTTLLGSIRLQTFNGEVLLRNNNISPNNINWALTDAMDNVNAMKLSNNDVELIAGSGADGSQLRISNTTRGPIKFRTGHGKLQSNAHDAMSIYNNQAVGTSQVVIGDNQTYNNRYDTSSKVVLDQTNLAYGMKVCNEGTTATTFVNNYNVETGAIKFQDDYAGSVVKSLYTIESGAKLMYDGNQIYPSTAPTGSSGGGITYIINNPTNQTNPASAPQITMSANYTSAAQTSITRSGYVVGQNYQMVRIFSDYIPQQNNPVLDGTYEANLWATYVGNSPAGIFGKLYHYAETGNFNGVALITKGYSGTGSGAVAALKTKAIGVPQVLTGFLFPEYGELVINIGIIIFPQVQITTAGSVTLTAYLRNNAGTTLYTFPVATGVTAGTSDRTFSALTGGLNLPTQVIATGLTNFYFELAITSGTGTITQASARGANDANYTLTATTRMLLYDGEGNKTPITANSTALYSLSLPMTASHDITDFTQYNKIIYDAFYVQTSGNATGHSISLLFRDGALSHLHTNINPATASQQATPTLAQVLVAGNTANNPIAMAGNSITGILTLNGSSGQAWNVRELQAGSGVSISNNGGGIYTITNSISSSSFLSMAWDNDVTSNGTQRIAVYPTLSVPLDIQNFRHEVHIDFHMEYDPANWINMSFNEVFTNSAFDANHYAINYGLFDATNYPGTFGGYNHNTYVNFAYVPNAHNGAIVHINMIVEANYSPATASSPAQGAAQAGRLGVRAQGEWNLVRKNSQFEGITFASKQLFTKYVYGEPLMTIYPNGAFVSAINYISIGCNNQYSIGNFRIRTRKIGASTI